MRSPFPGMDPYLEEQRWGDFHNRAVTYIADALQVGLPADLRARLGERVYLEWVEAPARQYVPDVNVYELPRTARGGAREAGGATAVAEPPAPTATDLAPVAEPDIVFVPAEFKEHFLQIIDVRSGGRVVTMIEVLSPSNKMTGRGREEYLRKQSETLRAAVNLVEIDLLRTGEPTTLAKPGMLPADRVTPYHASVHRAHRPDRIEYFRMPLRERLPRFPIPLRPTDPDVILDLQAVVDQTYDRGRYDDIDYRRPLSPPLIPADATWAQGIVAVPR
jgi:hypothetical protein